MHRSELVDLALSGVAETLLIPLYNRAMELQRPDALMMDQRAVEIVAQMSYDFDQVRKIRIHEANKVARIMLTREINGYARDFLSRNPDAVVVHIGCGLDTRFERVENDGVEWYDLDLPDVIGLRQEFIGDEGERYNLMACSVFDDGWLEAVQVHSQRPFLFLAENVFVYFAEAQVKSLVLRLRDHFPVRNWSSTAGHHSSFGWVASSSPTQSLEASCAGDSGAVRQLKVGARASSCSASGVSSTGLSRGWIPIAG